MASEAPNGRKFTIRVGKDRADNTETVSSPHTFAPTVGGGSASLVAALPGEFVDKPAINSVKVYPNDTIQGPAAVSNNSSHNISADAATNNSASMVDKVCFTIDNITPPIANLIRRAILTEVPTMAFDRILIEENDGVVLDELLSHSIGMCPLVAPVEQFQFVTSADLAAAGHSAPTPLPTVPTIVPKGVVPPSELPKGLAHDPTKMICFELDVIGDRSQALTVVYSGMLKWVNLGGCQQKMTEKDIHLVHHDIPIAKLGPGQRIKLKAFAIKGLGGAHAKWQPASACYYKLKTMISIDRKVLAEKEKAYSEKHEGKSFAKKLVKACPMRVFEMEDILQVADASRCTLCRECLAEPYEGAVVVEKSKTTVEFIVESMGQYHSAQLVPLAMKVFAERCRKLAQHVETEEPVTSKAVAE